MRYDTAAHTATREDVERTRSSIFTSIGVVDYSFANDVKLGDMYRSLPREMAVLLTGKTKTVIPSPVWTPYALTLLHRHLRKENPMQYLGILRTTFPSWTIRARKLRAIWNLEESLTNLPFRGA